MIQEKEDYQQIKNLNAIGDDRNLAQDGDNRHYWYSISDVMMLLASIRKQKLSYSFEEYQQLSDFSAIRQNNEGIFLADPYHNSDFQKYLNDDLSRIIGDHSESVQKKKAWAFMPTLIVLPLLSEMQWRTIAIQVNYKKNNINIYWDDPYGIFPAKLKQKIILPIKANIINLINRNQQILNGQSANTFLKADVSISQQYIKKIDQQGLNQNSWDCGPIIISNINDYLQSYSSRGNLSKIKYTIGSYKEINHEMLLQDIRREHIIKYSKINKNTVDEQRLNHIREVCQKNNKAKLQLVNKQFQLQLSKLNDFQINLFFTVIQNYQLLAPEQNNEDSIKYALSFIESEKNYKITKIIPKLQNNLLVDVAFFCLIPIETKFSSLNSALDKIHNGRQKYQKFLQKFNQKPKNRQDYRNSWKKIKYQLINQLFKVFKIEIDIYFAIQLFQLIKPILQQLSKEKNGPSQKSFIGMLASELLKKKQQEFPQIYLLNKYLQQNSKILNLQQDFKVQKLQKGDKHANSVYLVSNTVINQEDKNTIDYYAKTFSDDPLIFANNGLIDPNQLFCYKVLQYCGFGPECWFLMQNKSSSRRQISKGNFILTKNVAKGQDENQSIFQKIFSSSRRFAIQISAAAAINDILSLWDTFTNPGNYGVLFYNNSLNKLLKNAQKIEIKQQNPKQIEDYKIIFIDHLPNVSNGILSGVNWRKSLQKQSYKDTQICYSPRDHLFNSHKKPSKLIQLAQLSKKNGFNKSNIIKDVYKKFSDLKQWDILQNALIKAKKDVNDLLVACPSNFYRNEDKRSQQILQNYYQRIIMNIKLFDENYKQGSKKD